jgi:hypothetical protein
MDDVDLGRDDLPDAWLSRLGGEYFLGASFHFPAFNFPASSDHFSVNISYTASPFSLHHTQDPYNSWAVTASAKNTAGPMEHWDWLPGVLIVDESAKYTLPAEELSGFAGCEWADNDKRVFHGLLDQNTYDTKLNNFLHVINQVTGPGWANWPFGHRQLEHAVMCWLRPGDTLPEVLLLLGIRQSGAKFSYRRRDLYNPGRELGAWMRHPKTWDCRQAMRFVYNSALLAHDGLPELAVVSAIAALENASAEILLFLGGGNPGIVKSEFGKCKFLSRFDKVLPKYGTTLPAGLFTALKAAYLARNKVAHAAAPVSQSDAVLHVHAAEDVLAWYMANV